MGGSMNQNNLAAMEYVSNDDVVNPVAVTDKEGRLTVRSTLDSYEKALQDLMGSETGDMDDINANGLKEYFAGGSYVRELFIPKDCTIVTQIWKKERMWIIASGEVSFVTEMGAKRVKGPYTEIVPPGSKVALYTHEDTLWFAITGADAVSNETIKDEVIAESYDDCVYPWDKLEVKK